MILPAVRRLNDAVTLRMVFERKEQRDVRAAILAGLPDRPFNRVSLSDQDAARLDPSRGGRRPS
jgi:hypothetical protein